MKIVIFYFSGTGNTTWVAKQLNKKLTSKGNDVNLYNSEETDLSLINLDQVDLIGIMFPIHSSFAPKLMKNFIDHLPKSNDAKLFFTITTAGYFSGDVGWYATKKLTTKGYKPLLYGNIKMGNNFHLPYMSPLRVTSATKMFKRRQKADRKLKKIVEKIHDKCVYKEGVHVLAKIYGKIQRTIAKQFEKAAFKGFNVDKNCEKCEICIKKCPVDNIIMSNNKVTFLEHCIICMRCYNFCPKCAIQNTNKTKDTKKYKRYQGPEGKGIKSLH